MKEWRLRWLSSILLLACGLASASGIEYPLFGQFRASEGTIEVWITPVVDDLYPELEDKQYRKLFPLWSFDISDLVEVDAACSAKGKPKETQHFVHVSMSSSGMVRGLLPARGPLPAGLAPGEPMHVAFTWRERDMRVYLNGEEIGKRTQASAFPEVPPGTVLTVGAVDKRSSPVIVHAVRLSGVARTAGDLSAATPSADIYTLLLDVFDDNGAVLPGGLTVPLVASGLEGPVSGRLRGAWHFSREATRPGLALFEAP